MSLWLKGLVGYLLIVSVVMQMLPNGKYEQYVKLFTGFLLIIFVLQPLLKIGSADSFMENKIEEFVQEQERLEEQIGIQSDAFRRKSKDAEQESLMQIEIEPIDQVRVEVKADD